MYLLGLGLLLSFLASAAESAPPFWKSKEKVYERVKNREIIVAVRAKAVEGGSRLHAAGGGHVHAPRDFVFKSIQDYEKLANSVGYIRDAKYSANTRTLKFLVSAFGFNSMMETEFLAIDDKEQPRLEFLLVSGPVKGFKGTISINSIGAEKSEMALNGIYEYKKFPLPRLFLEFGLEVIYQRIAFKVRQQIEKDFREKKVSEK